MSISILSLIMMVFTIPQLNVDQVVFWDSSVKYVAEKYAVRNFLRGFFSAFLPPLSIQQQILFRYLDQTVFTYCFPPFFSQLVATCTGRKKKKAKLLMGQPGLFYFCITWMYCNLVSVDLTSWIKFLGLNIDVV